MIPNRYEVGTRLLVYCESQKRTPPWSRWRAYSQGDLVTDASGVVWVAQRAVGPLATTPVAGADWQQPTTILVEGDATPSLVVTAPDGTATTYHVGDLNSRIQKLEAGAYLATIDLSAVGQWSYSLIETGSVAFSATREVLVYARGKA